MKKLSNYLDNKKVILAILLIVSILTLLICSKNSPLYPYNDWVDGNAFFTMGKGMFNGKVPYKDLFEQKGPLLYLIYGIGYLISHDTFLGVYLLEVISYTIFGFFLFKIARTYLNQFYALLASVLTLAIISGSISFVQGGSAEEFCLPFVASNIYFFIKIINENDFGKKYLLINGAIAGCVSLIKFNLLGLWFIWMALYFFKLISLKEIKKAFISCVYFLVGMFIPIFISILYFVINGALRDYYDVYITFNLTAYSTTIDLKTRILNMFSAIFQQMKYNRTIYILLCLCFVNCLTTKILKNIWINIFILLSFIFLMIGVYVGGLPFIYYFLCFEAYIIFGFIFVFSIVQNYLSSQTLAICILCGGMIFSVHYPLKSPNRGYMNIPQSAYAQYVFKDIIDKSKNKTLLNYDNLDGGFYTTCNIVPNVKYFMRQNVGYDRYPQIIDGQREAIKNKEIEFVVIREYKDTIGYRKNIPYLNDNYKEIKKFKQLYEGMDFTYYLYCLK